MGRDEGAQYGCSRAASPGALLPRSSHDGPLVQRTSPSSTYTWHMGLAASREAPASSSGWYGQRGLRNPQGPASRPAAQTAADRALQSLAEGEVLPLVAESPGGGQRPVSLWP